MIRSSQGNPHAGDKFRASYESSLFLLWREVSRLSPTAPVVQANGGTGCLDCSKDS